MRKIIGSIAPLYIDVKAQLTHPLAPVRRAIYQQRGINSVRLPLKKYFQNIASQYKDNRAIIYGRFRINRITEVVEKFILCGDYPQGVARIQCTNPNCKYELLRGGRMTGGLASSATL